MNTHQYILGIDTSHSRGQLCLLCDDMVVENIFWDKKGSHSENLNFHFEQLLEKKGLKPQDIKRIYCSTGPGSFTGLRVGVNFAKTLAYTLQIELVAVNTLLALAYLCTHTDKPIIACIDAQRNAVFLSQFSGDKSTLVENKVVNIKELDQYINSESYLCGKGLQQYGEHVDDKLLNLVTVTAEWEQPNLLNVIQANEKKSFLKTTLWQQIQPLYIRLSAAEEKQKSS